MSAAVEDQDTSVGTDRGARPAALAAVAVLLAVGAIAAAVIEVAWLTVWLGPVPAPVTILLALAWSVLAVRVAGRWSRARWFRLWPLGWWLATLVALDLGPGADLPLPIGLRAFALVVAGLVVPAWSVLLSPPRPGSSRGPAPTGR